MCPPSGRRGPPTTAQFADTLFLEPQPRPYLRITRISTSASIAPWSHSDHKAAARRKHKRKVIPRISNSEITPELAKSIESVKVSVQNNEHSSSEIVSNNSPPVDLASCSEIQYEVKDGINGVAYSLSEGDSGWTPVVGKKRRVPDYIRCRFPPDHPIHNSPESDSDSTPEEDLNTVIPMCGCPF